MTRLDLSSAYPRYTPIFVTLAERATAPGGGSQGRLLHVREGDVPNGSLLAGPDDYERPEADGDEHDSPGDEQKIELADLRELEVKLSDMRTDEPLGVADDQEDHQD